MRAIIGAAALAAAVAGGPTQAATGDFGPLSWLVGRWTGAGGGAQVGAGAFSFLPDAGGTVLVRRNVADYPPQNGRSAQHHEDLMVIFREGQAWRATYWDSEGQTIHYAVTTPSPDEVTFVSDNVLGPRFRLSYRRTAQGLAGRFEIAPPPDRDRFRGYLTWTAVRGN
jgi:hypothetical protein